MSRETCEWCLDTFWSDDGGWHPFRVLMSTKGNEYVEIIACESCCEKMCEVLDTEDPGQEHMIDKVKWVDVKFWNPTASFTSAYLEKLHDRQKALHRREVQIQVMNHMRVSQDNDDDNDDDDNDDEDDDNDEDKVDVVESVGPASVPMNSHSDEFPLSEICKSDMDQLKSPETKSRKRTKSRCFDSSKLSKLKFGGCYFS